MKNKDSKAKASTDNNQGADKSASPKSPNQKRVSKSASQIKADLSTAKSEDSIAQGHLQSNAESKAAEPEAKSNKNSPPTQKSKPARKVTNPLEQAEYFGKQYTKSADLPDPGELLKVLACGIVQVLAGERPVDQLAKMVTADLYLQLRDAALVNMRKRLYSPGKANPRLQIEVRRVRLEAPRDGVIESVVLLHSDSRTRAVAIRLEGLNARWQATMVNVL